MFRIQLFFLFREEIIQEKCIQLISHNLLKVLKRFLILPLDCFRICDPKFHSYILF